MLRSKLVVKSLATLVLASGSIAALAADSGWYAGASLGQSSTDYEAGTLKSALEAAGATGVVASVDNTDTAWKLFGGYQLNKNLGFEAAYVDLGSLTGNATYTAPAGSPYRFNTDGDGFLFSVVGTLPVSDTVAVFGKVGAFSWNLDQTTSTSLASVKASADGIDLAYGLGVNWQINKSIGLRAEWERFQVGGENGFAKSDVDMYSLGAAFHF